MHDSLTANTDRQPKIAKFGTIRRIVFPSIFCNSKEDTENINENNYAGKHKIWLKALT